MNRNDYSFLVERNKGSNRNRSEQSLFCRCGHKQKSKLSVKRILLKNPETVFEDKYEIDNIKCDVCGETFNLYNSILVIKSPQSTLAEVSYEKETSEQEGEKIIKLYRNKKYYHYLESQDSVLCSVVTDSIVFYTEKKRFLIEYRPNENESSNAWYESEKQKKNEFEFDLTKERILEPFFTYDGSVNHKNLEVAFDFFNSILSHNYDYEILCQNKFVSDFLVSKTIITEFDGEKKTNFIMKRDMFGGNNLVKKKLDVGDYINKLQKFSEICLIFTVFPPISTILKLKGLQFIHNAYKIGFIASFRKLNESKATSPSRILEVCCKNYNLITSLKENSWDDGFRLSPVLLKSINEPDDIIVLHRFSNKKIISKVEIESLFQKYESQDVFYLMSKLNSTSNFRNVQLDIRHLNHILRNEFFLCDGSEWLSIYYDTINSLNLIVEIIENKKKEGKPISKFRKLSRLSQDKLFEVKDYEKLRILHDEMTAVYRALEDESKDAKYQAVVKAHSNLNMKLDMFDFRVIPNLNELSKEGLVMHHCIYTYLNDIASGGYLAIRIKDLVSNERATMGVKIEKKKMYLQQLKGYYNSRATGLLIDTCLKFCKKVEIQIESSHLHSNDIVANQSLVKRMKDYLDPETASKIRKQGKRKK